jgi:DNA invertase Pin-like site-specific DNA recombinase
MIMPPGKKHTVTRSKPTSAFVGYIRVSTTRQEAEGFSLDTQERIIKSWAHEARKHSDWIYSDAGTARGAGSFVTRNGLRDSIKQALHLAVPLVVPNVSRLSRDVAVLKEIERSGVAVISIQDGGRRLSKSAMRDLVRKAEVEGQDIAERAKRAARFAKSRGALLGNRTNLPVAQRRGCINNVVRADVKTKELADFLERTPGWHDLKRQELVDLLNTSGPLNLISEKRSERQPWRVSTLRKPLLKAVDELALRSEDDDEDDDDDIVTTYDDDVVVASVSQDHLKIVSDGERRRQVEEDFKNHPNFDVI